MNAPSSFRSEAPARFEHAKERLRKLAIVALFALVLGPMLILNCGVNLEKAGYESLAAGIRKPISSLDALLLRQQWTLFTDISPFNYTTHFEVVLQDGSTVPLDDPAPQKATGWNGILFHNEAKIRNNLYGFVAGSAVTCDYLIRRNGIDSAAGESAHHLHSLSQSAFAVGSCSFGNLLRSGDPL